MRNEVFSDLYGDIRFYEMEFIHNRRSFSIKSTHKMVEVIKLKEKKHIL